MQSLISRDWSSQFIANSLSMEKTIIMDFIQPRNSKKSGVNWKISERTCILAQLGIPIEESKIGLLETNYLKDSGSLHGTIWM